METRNLFDRERSIWKVLPLHPQPQPLESFTSYIMRLTEANGFKSINELATLAGARWSREYASPDYPCPPYGGLARIAVCTEATLGQMTFQNLAQCFGCPTHPTPLRRFLQGSLAPNLRYCPRCLAERPCPYYSLIWRFLAVQGCAYHKCVLLYQCGHCSASLPLVTQSARMAWCPSCQGDLRTCQAYPLSTEATVSTYTQTNDLEKILTSEQWKSDEKPAVEIGKHFASLRQRKHLALPEVAQFLGKDEQIALEIEYGNLNREATFHHYVQYAGRLNSSLQEIMEMVLFQEELPLDEEGLLKKVDEAAQGLLAQGMPTTPAQIARHIGLSVQQLRKSSRVNSLLVTWEHQQRRTSAKYNDQREEELVLLVKHAIKDLEHRGERVTQNRIAHLLGMSTHGLRIYSRVEALLMNVNITRSQQRSYLANHLERRKALLRM